MAKRKPPSEPEPDFSAAVGGKDPGLVIITHPYWDDYGDRPCDFDTMIALADAERFHEELGHAIAAARLVVAERQEAARKAAGAAIDAELDKILGLHRA